MAVADLVIKKKGLLFIRLIIHALVRAAVVVVLAEL